MRYLANAFSLQMLEEFPAHIVVREIEREEVPDDVHSVVGHADTAAILGVEYRRENITLKRGDVLYVAQLQGGRLPEGATALPDGFSFRFLRVTVAL